MALVSALGAASSRAALPSDPAGVPFVTFSQALAQGDYALACEQLAAVTLKRATIPPPPNVGSARKACALGLASDDANLDEADRQSLASTRVVRVRVTPGRARVTIETTFLGIHPRSTGTALMEDGRWKILKLPSDPHVGTSYLREIPSESMLPTLHVGETVLVDHAAYRHTAPRVGDIVVFHPPVGAETAGQCGRRPPRRQACAIATPRNSRTTFVKRIVARAGDRIALRRGWLYRNGRRASEPYVKPCTPRDHGCNFPRTFRVAPGRYYVLGDNRGASDDSRYWGPITAASIVGKVRRLVTGDASSAREAAPPVKVRCNAAPRVSGSATREGGREATLRPVPAGAGRCRPAPRRVQLNRITGCLLARAAERQSGASWAARCPHSAGRRDGAGISARHLFSRRGADACICVLAFIGSNQRFPAKMIDFCTRGILEGPGVSLSP